MPIVESYKINLNYRNLVSIVNGYDPLFINFMGKIMALINTSIKPFKTQAFYNGKFISLKETEGPKLVARPD